jgi:transglutaminase-like putative cysteine protease
MTTLGQFQRVPGDDVSFTGFSDEIEFGSVRRIQESNALAFRAEMPELPGGGLYWRGIVLDAFNGRMWRSTRMPGARSVPQPEEEAVRQEIYLEPGYHSILFALDKPVHINEAGAFPAGDAVFMNRRYRLMGRLNYTAFSSVSPTLRPDPPDVRRDRYLSLPDDFIPGLKGVLGDITAGLSPDEYPGAIMAWLAPPRFDYSLEDLPSAVNPMEDFFFTHRMGNCEYFASAMAVMLRMAGIPSRLVAGYHGGVYNDSGSYYMVNQSNAHVWVEAWDDAEKLWRRYDPTPISGGGASGGTSASEYSIFGMYLDLVNHLISRAFVGYSRESQSRLLQSARSFMSDPAVRVYSFLERIQAAPRAWIIAFACILGAASSAVAVRFSRRRAFGGSASHEAVVREKFIRLMGKLGWRRRAGDGLEEFVESMRGDPRFGEAFFDMAFEFVTEFEEFYFRDIPMDSAARARLEKLLKRMKANVGDEAVARAGRTAKIRK